MSGERIGAAIFYGMLAGVVFVLACAGARLSSNPHPFVRPRRAFWSLVVEDRGWVRELGPRAGSERTPGVEAPRPVSKHHSRTGNCRPGRGVKR